MVKQKVILAYSGGLDTSVILKWLLNKGYEVVCFMADIGQEEDFDKAKKKALKIGASKIHIADVKKEFVEKYIFRALKANAKYEGKYLLGTSIARPLIAKAQIEVAKKENTNFVSHGATGKGNDQVRFEMTYMQLMSNVEIISPWKDNEFLKQFKGRTDCIEFAKKEGIPIEATSEKPYSIDENLMHTSYESGILEDPGRPAPEGMIKYNKTPESAPDKAVKITIEFKQGVPVKVTNSDTGESITGSLELFKYLNKLGRENGIGIIDIVESRFIGMKSRGVYATPGATILWKAHADLEGLTLDKEVIQLKDSFMPKIAQLIYNGFWFSPEMDFLMAGIEHSQKNVIGNVHLTLYKGNVIVTARDSPMSLYDVDVVSMEKKGGSEKIDYDPIDAKGFIKLNALRLRLAKK